MGAVIGHEISHAFFIPSENIPRSLPKGNSRIYVQPNVLN
nr:hypothetical protein [Maribacter sp. ACAM166]